MRERQRTGRVTARTARRAALGGALAAGVLGLGAAPAGATFGTGGTGTASTPPATWVPLPTPTVITVAPGETTGPGSIDNNEIDWYAFVAPHTGIYSISSRTPASNLDTVLGLYDATGTLVASNDDIDGAANRDSSVLVFLNQGSSYQFGVSNFSTLTSGAYTWHVQASSSK
jgi:hypothetical protein